MFSEPTFCFKYKFGVTQQYSSDPLYKEQRKTVKTENAVTSMKTLVGSIGGTLGMFVGYSLIGTIEWLTSICANFKMRWTQKVVSNCKELQMIIVKMILQIFTIFTVRPHSGIPFGLPAPYPPPGAFTRPLPNS